MNAEAHLISLGWAGPGNALNSHIKSHKGRGGLGLTKPLLVSQKKNTFGIGKKAHEPASGNDWWLKGFEKALQGVGTNGEEKSGSEATSGTATPVVGASSGYAGKHSGLYGFFVRGEQMQGTLTDEDLQPVEPEMLKTSEKKNRKGKKRKSEVLQEDTPVTSPSTDETAISARKSRKRNEPGPAHEFAQISEFLEIRDKERRKQKRAERHGAAVEFQQIGAFMDARDDVDPALENRRKRSHKNRDDEGEADIVPAEQPVNGDEMSEDEAARKNRRRKRKEEKIKRRKEQEEQASRARERERESQWSKLLESK